MSWIDDAVNNKKKTRKRDPDWWRHHKIPVLQIGNERVLDETIDVSEFEFVRVFDSDVNTLTLLKMKGELGLGTGHRRSTFENCRVIGAELTRLDLGNADFRNCEFVDCDIHELGSFEANVSNCKFSGRIRKGIVFLRRPSPELEKFEAVFEANDFSDCVIDESLFRGGIDLGRQRFKSDGSAVIQDSTVFLNEVRKKLGKKVPSAPLKRFLFGVEFYASNFNQNSFFVPLRDFQKLGSEVELIQDLISPL